MTAAASGNKSQNAREGDIDHELPTMTFTADTPSESWKMSNEKSYFLNKGSTLQPPSRRSVHFGAISNFWKSSVAA